MSKARFVILYDKYTVIEDVILTVARFPPRPDTLSKEIFTNKQHFDKIVEIAVTKAVQNAAMLTNRDRRRESRDREE